MQNESLCLSFVGGAMQSDWWCSVLIKDPQDDKGMLNLAQSQNDRHFRGRNYIFGLTN